MKRTSSWVPITRSLMFSSMAQATETLPLAERPYSSTRLRKRISPSSLASSTSFAVASIGIGGNPGSDPFVNAASVSLSNQSGTSIARANFGVIDPGSSQVLPAGVYHLDVTVLHQSFFPPPGLPGGATNTPVSASIQCTFGIRPGDLNGDGRVDIFDINDVSSHWGGSGPEGDANGDGKVNIFDINEISSHWSDGGVGGNATAVPEPAALTLTVIGVGLLLFGCLRRQS